MEKHEKKKMVLDQAQTKHHGYVLLMSDESKNLQHKKGAKYTLLKIGCFLLAVLNVITSLGIAMGCVIYTGLRSIIFALDGTKRDVVTFGISIFYGAMLTAASVAWIVMIGFFIRSLVKRKRIRGPKLLGKTQLHTVAVWMMILRAILGSVLFALETTNNQETSYIVALELCPIEFVVNVSFVLTYYWYAVKLDFGLISDEAN